MCSFYYHLYLYIHCIEEKTDFNQIWNVEIFWTRVIIIIIPITQDSEGAATKLKLNILMFSESTQTILIKLC